MSSSRYIYNYVFTQSEGDHDDGDDGDDDDMYIPAVVNV